MLVRQRVSLETPIINSAQKCPKNSMVSHKPNCCDTMVWFHLLRAHLRNSLHTACFTDASVSSVIRKKTRQIRTPLFLVLPQHISPQEITKTGPKTLHPKDLLEFGGVNPPLKIWTPPLSYKLVRLFNDSSFDRNQTPVINPIYMLMGEYWPSHTLPHPPTLDSQCMSMHVTVILTN